MQLLRQVFILRRAVRWVHSAHEQLSFLLRVRANCSVSEVCGIIGSAIGEGKLGGS